MIVLPVTFSAARVAPVDTDSCVVEAVLVTCRLETVAPVAERLVVEALLIVAVPVVFELVNVAPVAERLDVEALPVTERLAIVAPVDTESCEVEAVVIVPAVNDSPLPEIPVVEAWPRVV